jgi:hypothetical protein
MGEVLKMAGIRKDIYLSKDNAEWLKNKSAETGESISRIIDTVILAARLREELNKETPPK